MDCAPAAPAATASPSGPREDPAIWSARFRRARLVLVAAAALFLVLTGFGLLSLLPGLIGFAVVSAAALVGARLPDGFAGGRPEPNAPPDATAWLDAVLAGLPDPVIALDRGGRVIALNPQAAVLAPALHRGEPASFALRTPEIVAALRRATGTGHPQSVEFTQRVPLDRSYRVFVTPIRWSPSAPGGFDSLLMTFHDLTPLRRVEEMRADFVANASHELRTPLAALSGFIETLQGPARNDDAARERFLGIMHAQASRMARLIDDLLSLSRIELNEHLRPRTAVDLGSILRQVRDGLETLAASHGVAVEINAPAEPCRVLGDRDELIRLFENLVENALKYGAAGGRVEILLAPDEGPDPAGEIRVSVRDHGPGIAPEHLPRLTERFYRVDVGESRALGGTGLGLALVKHILNRHGGRLAIDSVPGAGATFTVRLPAAKPVPREASVSPGT